MAITFRVLPHLAPFLDTGRNIAYLHPASWDDYNYKTLFSLTVFDEQGGIHQVGSVKIGYVGQNIGWTKDNLPESFERLTSDFYALGQDPEYYQNLVDDISDEMSTEILSALNDVVKDTHHLETIGDEEAFKTSLKRHVSRSTIDHQFRRILQKEAPLTHYDFSYKKDSDDQYAGLMLDFSVKPQSLPPSNIHILIGRNGVGKTTILNNMVDALLQDSSDIKKTGQFTELFDSKALPDNYFTGVVSVSFSAFDPFTPPDDQPDIDAGMRYHYIGLKKPLEHGQSQCALKTGSDLSQDIIESLKLCFTLSAKRNRWMRAVQKLESDMNFADMNLCQLADIYDTDLSDEKVGFSEKVTVFFERMSSGHTIVLLTLTRLVETVEEKTLVLIDEPESHLHPPLLSAFSRVLSDLLTDRNGVGIIATHSPVVLQEVPKLCVSILRRNRLIFNVDRPEKETFAENVGVLTREVFGLEVSQSGYHNLLASSVEDADMGYQDIEKEYGYQLGFEGKAILRVMVSSRDSKKESG